MGQIEVQKAVPTSEGGWNKEWEDRLKNRNIKYSLIDNAIVAKTSNHGSEGHHWADLQIWNNDGNVIASFISNIALSGEGHGLDPENAIVSYEVNRSIILRN